jgi:hypothetical protein
MAQSCLRAEGIPGTRWRGLSLRAVFTDAPAPGGADAAIENCRPISTPRRTWPRSEWRAGAVVLHLIEIPYIFGSAWSTASLGLRIEVTSRPRRTSSAKTNSQWRRSRS